MREFEMVSAKIKAIDRKLESEDKAFERAKIDYKKAHSYYHKTKKELEILETDSLQNWVYRLFDKQEEKINEEKQEMIKAKVELDLAKRIVDRTDTYLKELEEELNQEKSYLKHLQKEYADDPVYQKISKQEKEKREQWMREVFEMDEAYKVGKKVLEVIENALENLDSADSWATADIFFGKSLLIDMVKYNKIDDAEEEVIQIEALLSQYQDELDDVSEEFFIQYESITSLHRIVDLFFDNIFTDWSTKNKIRGNIEVLENLTDDIRKIQQSLSRAVSKLEEKVDLSFQLFE